MCEFGQLDAVLLAQERLVMTPLPDIVDLDRFVAFGGHTQLAGVVEID